MLKLPESMHIYVSSGHTDMRKQADGLCAVVKAALQEEPKSGHLFVFFNRHRDIIRILFWDLNGYCVVSKRLDGGRFRALEVQEGQTKVVIDAKQLAELLALAVPTPTRSVRAKAH